MGLLLTLLWTLMLCFLELLFVLRGSHAVLCLEFVGSWLLLYGLGYCLMDLAAFI